MTGALARWRLPLLTGLRGYRLRSLPTDFSAGLAVAAVGLPSALAYPALAGLPPETGLYACLFPLVAYALFGPSRQLVVGPDAATMTVLAAVLAAEAARLPEGAALDRGAAAAALALGVGALCLAARALGFGMLAAFLSRPILTGFFAGISLSILIGQIGRVTGVRIEADGLVAPLVELAGKAGLVHLPTLALAGACFAALQLLAALRSPVPGPVAVLAAATALSALVDFPRFGIAVVGDVPAGLPALALPDPRSLSAEGLVLGAAAVFLVSFGAGAVTARSFGARGGYRVDPDAELTGFGAANIAAGLTGAFPVTASDSRTAINASVGGRSQIVSLVAAGAVAAMLAFLGPALAALPIPALGAILVSAALSMIDLGALREVWRISRAEFAFAMIAFFGPLGLGVLSGVVIAVLASLVHLLRQAMAPHDALLGRVEGREGFYKLHRRADARPVPGLAVWTFQSSLVFFNADYARARLAAVSEALPPGTRWLVIDAGAIPHIDSTGAGTLADAAADLAARGVRLGLAELHFEARALLDRAGVLARIGPEMVFDDLDDALTAFGAGETAAPPAPIPPPAPSTVIAPPAAPPAAAAGGALQTSSM
jgi:high affinity sulfate transporter 1